MRKPVVIGVVFVVGMLAAIVYSTLPSAGFRVEVCLNFHGTDICKVASGASEELAIRAAHDNACGQIASGVTDTIACGATPARSITMLSKK